MIIKGYHYERGLIYNKKETELKLYLAGSMRLGNDTAVLQVIMLAIWLAENVEIG